MFILKVNTIQYDVSILINKNQTFPYIYFIIIYIFTARIGDKSIR